MAVYTDVSFEELELFLENYDIGTPRVFKGIAEGVSNSNYFLQTDKASFILTLYEKRIETDELPFFLGLMEHLAAEGLPCPTPVHAKDGSTTGTLNARSAAILTFLEGVSLRRPSAEHCSLAGAALANLHLRGANFPQQRENALGLSSWKSLAAECVADTENVTRDLKNLIEAELDFHTANWPRSLPTGIIHADFFPDNVLFVKKQVSGIIDFYFACRDAFSYDLAVALNAWCFEADGSYNVTKGQALFAGYETVRALEQAERDALPILCRGAALRFLITRLFDWLNHSPEALVNPKDPDEFARRLRFHQGARGPDAYGL
ncbi:MAG: homoserine kinase [Micropepsaceae bacterium]